MDRHPASQHAANGSPRGRQRSWQFPLLTIVLGSLVVACGSKSKPTDIEDPGPPANLVANSTTVQNSGVGVAVNLKPSVKVTDAEGLSVPDVEVTFAVTSGGGSLTGAVQTTNAVGVATVGSWTTGAVAGANTMTATVTGLNGSPVTFTANASATPSNFNIKLVFINTPTTNQRAAFEAAQNKWQTVVTGDLSPITLSNETRCGGNISETIDDLLIVVNLGPIDGPGQVLGSAGPCLTRVSNGLTIVGAMTFDTADLANLEANGSLPDVILHEMGHVLGIGSLWDSKGLLAGGCVEDPNNPGTALAGTGLAPSFTGASALAAYKNSNGGGSATSVPVENYAGNDDGCPNGTRDSHWEEGLAVSGPPANGIGFRSELMTGFITGTVRPLSLTTVRSLADLGYTVDNSQAQPFDINTQPTLRADGTEPPVIDLTGDTWKGPRYSIDDRPGGTGKITRIR